MMKHFIFLFASIFIAGCATAQPQPDGSSANKKAQKLYLDAQAAAMQRDLNKATELVNKALEKDPQFSDALYLRAELYSFQNQYKQAIEGYQAVLKANNQYSIALYKMALAAMDCGEYTVARNALEMFMRTPKIPAERMNNCQTMLRNAEFGEEALRHPVPFQPKNLGPGINTALKDYFPSVTVDGQMLIFDRNENGDENFFVSRRTSDGWGPAARLDMVNTTENESYATFTADGKYVFFVKFEQGNGLDIFFSSFNNNQWNKPQNLGGPVNSKFWESQPCIAPDGQTLIFTSNRPGGTGGSDLYMSTYQNGQWSAPANLGKAINTPGIEEAPFLHPDGQTLYFVSDGHAGMGGLDIFMSRRNPDGSWGTPVNIGYPINTHEDERSLFVTAQGKEAFITSGQLGGQGDWDIYSFELPESVRPKQVTYVRGRTLDSLNGQPVQAMVELTNLKTGKVSKLPSSKNNGEFTMVLNSGESYAFNITSADYLLYSETYQFNEIGTSLKPIEKDFKLNKIVVGKSVELRNVFFPTNSFQLQPESYTELNKVVAFLKSKPNIKMELSGHTDNVGKKTDNLTLSQNRAKAVKEYLVSQGIDANRLTFKGYGDTLPRYDNGTEDGRKMNRRTECKITGL